MVAKATLLVDAVPVEPARVDEGLALARQAIGVEPVDGERLRASRHARAMGWTILGRVQERRGRVTQALDSFVHALAADDSHVPALLGAGRVMLADRPADALARFESVLQAEGSDAIVVASGRTAQQEAQLGRGRALLALDRVGEAKDVLEPLAAAREDDAEVLRWLGRAEESLDPPNREAAEQHYRAAIQAAPTTFPPYLALAQLFLASERASDAGAVLEQAESRVPESSEMRYQLGVFEIQRNAMADASRELRRALELEPDHPPALFSLGVAYRRSGQLELAAETFERLAAVDTGHPGLALERGLLFEARGESVRAVEAYRAALEEQPDDLDLLLRLGAAQVAARQIDDAEQTLARVRQARPNSAEAHHFVGRVAFARGRYAEALTNFRQAVRLDPSRGEFHLYAGWAALENGQLGEALRSVDDAIERDPSLGDAYWVRGEVEQRTGHPDVALTDLTRALELRPGRAEIHAAMGEAYNDKNQLPQAIAAYERAVEAVDDNGEWWYRLGRLQLDRGNRAEAGRALARATLLGDAMSPLPGWLADAHRLQADALRLAGQRPEAIQHYRRYLELAPASAIDIRDVRRILLDLGGLPPGE
jgi:tetratricopeptide (TPR) repeat protein